MKKSASINSLSNDSFLSELSQFSQSIKFWIACSGGLDSCVLLHLFYLNKNKINQDIEVVFVNHGLQDEAEEWAIFCEKQCKQYDFPFKQLNITENCPRGESIEAWARDKRYSLIEEIMNEDDVLFTAHHQDDQVETFFLQALRGSGPRGLAAMPLLKENKKSFHARPLMNYSRKTIKNYADEHNLSWVTDNSNSDRRYDRNYLRHEVMPEIEKRWPAYRETISRLITHQQESKLLLDDLGLDDLKLAKYENTTKLDLEIVKKLSSERQKNLIFIWLKELSLAVPGSKNMQQIISDIIYSERDKAPCVNWANVEVRKYKNLLYASNNLKDHDVSIEYIWNEKEKFNIRNETIIAKPETGKGISIKKVHDAEFIIRYRQGGEKIHPNELPHSKTVKQLFQESAVLPWLRDRVPLIYINGNLAVIPGFCIDERYAADENEESLDIIWSGYRDVIDNQ